MDIKKIAGAFLIIAVLGTAGFFVGRQLVGGGATEAGQPAVGARLEELFEARDEEQTDERFNGELLGIYIAPSRDQVPQEFREVRVPGVEGCVSLPLEEARVLAMARPLVMPEGYAVSETDTANTGNNPWALACHGILWTRGWAFTTTGPEGTPATVSVIRSTFKYATADVAASRVSTQVIGGRQAIVISPLVPGGFAEQGRIYFPEPFGKTSISAFNLSEAELLEVAEAVAEATR